MDWKHGYYAESGYIYGYYPETMPLRLHWAALLQGHHIRRKRFRYLDAGCGQGYNLIMAAVCHPDAEFVGIDFLPEHIAHGRQLAEQCGLTNVKFIEGDFCELVNTPEELGQFDYAVCHGIATWIKPEIRESLFALIGKVLVPGGVFYNSYNTLPGWLGAVPFQHLVLLEQRCKSGLDALTSASAKLNSLKSISPLFFKQQPGLERKLASVTTSDPAYLVQEYNNQFWQPLFVSQMMDLLAPHKLAYLGSATLPEAFEELLPADLRQLITQEGSIVMKEQLKDYAFNQQFRRDLYVKGKVAQPKSRRLRYLLDTRVVSFPLIARPKEGEAFTLKYGSVSYAGDSVLFNRILSLCDEFPDGVAISALIEQGGWHSQVEGEIQAVSMLVHGSWLMLCNEESTHGNAQVAKVLTEAATEGLPYEYLSLPGVGAAIKCSNAHLQLLNLALQGVPAGERVERLVSDLQKKGMSLTRKQIGAKEDSIVALQAVANSVEQALPFYQRMGLI